MQKRLNFHYGTIHGTYWMCFGALYSFSSVFLLSKGYSNSEIGVILALANLLAVLIQPFLADFADRKNKTTIFSVMFSINGIILAFALMLALSKGRSMMLSISFLGVIAALLLNQPFANSINRRLEETGVRIKFGVCRSAGSFCYAVYCLILGMLTNRFGAGILPYSEIVALGLFTLAIIGTLKGYRESAARVRVASESVSTNRDPAADQALAAAPSVPRANQEVAPSAPKSAADEISLGEFVKSHKVFLILSLGTLGLYFSNTTINMYMAQIASNIGGNSEDVGRVFSLLAFMEIPTLILFDKLYDRFRCESMLKFSAVGFILWVGSCALAKNVGMLLGAQIFQMFAFALYLPAMVRFIDDNMREKEAIKGQTLFTTVTTAAAVFAGLLGGRIIDVLGVSAMTIIATVVTAVGAAIIFLTVDRAGGRGTKQSS